MPFIESIELIDAPESGFPFELPAVKALEGGLELHPKVTFIVGENGLERVAFEETEHFFLTQRFLNDRKGMLERLLAPDGSEDTEE